MTLGKSHSLCGLLPSGAHAYEIDLGRLAGNPAEQRRREFDAGRTCARAALNDARIAGHVGRNADRSPAWPCGATGSIAHCANLAVAVAAATTDLHGLGVDVEERGAVSDELVPILMTPAERSAPASGRGFGDLTELFSMKEASYKCWYPVTGVVLEFLDIEVTSDPATGTFRAEMVTRSRKRPGHVQVQGRYGIRAGHVFATAWIGASSREAAIATELELA